jgi:hypothetical protein
VSNAKLALSMAWLVMKQAVSMVSTTSMSMNIKQLAETIGKEGLYIVNGLKIKVKVTDAKQAYGRIDYQIEPVNGQGQIWVNSTSVKMGE